jgi:hypothetical protein
LLVDALLPQAASASAANPHAAATVRRPRVAKPRRSCDRPSAALVVISAPHIAVAARRRPRRRAHRQTTGRAIPAVRSRAIEPLESRADHGDDGLEAPNGVSSPGGSGMRRAVLVAVVVAVTGVFGAAFASAGYARAPRFGTVQGNVTTQGGQPLNGMCLHLFDVKYTTDEIQFAGSGNGGPTGFFTQANVPVGKYKGLFFNCGANTAGNPDPNYENIFYGGTFKPQQALKITVTNNTTTTLGTTQIPLGGTVTGTVTDSTASQPAWPLVVQAQIPNDLSYNAFQVVLTVCASPGGSYTISGIPTTGVHIVFAPAGWSCPDGSGTYVEPFNPSTYPRLVKPPSDGTKTGIDGSVTENGSPFAHGSYAAAARRARAAAG